MNLPKKQGQRLIPEYLLKYNEELQKNHPDPTASWGGGSGGDYTAGEGIDITDHIISIDDETVALKTDIPTNYVTTDSDQEITGIKTFTGDKRVRFKQDAAAKRIGFTGFDYHWDGTNVNKNQLGYLEMNDSDQNHNNGPSNILGVYYPRATPGDPYRGKDFALGFEYYKVGGSDTYTHWYSLLVPPCYDGNNITLERYIPVDFKNGNTIVRSDKTGVVDLSSLMPTIPTNVSSFTNDAGYITDSALTGYATELWVTNQGYSTFSGSYNDLTDKPTIPTATSDLTNDSGFITSSALSGYATESWVSTQGYITGITSSDVTTALGYTPVSYADLATVATTGSYNDLTDKPTIPTVPTYTTLFNVTPTSGTDVYSITLADDITNYDEIKIYYNEHDDTRRKYCQIKPELVVGDYFTLQCYGNSTNPRLYTKNDYFHVTSATTIVLDSSIQQRIGNNESAVIAFNTNMMRCRPYKIIGIKY